MSSDSIAMNNDTPEAKARRAAGIARAEELDNQALAWSRAHPGRDARGYPLTRFAAVAHNPRMHDCYERVIHVEALNKEAAGKMILGVARALYPDDPNFEFDYYNLYSEDDRPDFVLRFIRSAAALFETYATDHIVCFSVQIPPFHMEDMRTPEEVAADR